jgi:hypothetical protein
MHTHTYTYLPASLDFKKRLESIRQEGEGEKRREETEP